MLSAYYPFLAIIPSQPSNQPPVNKKADKKEEKNPRDEHRTTKIPEASPSIHNDRVVFITQFSIRPVA